MMSVCRYCIDNCRYLDIYTCRCVVVTAKAADLVSVAAAAAKSVHNIVEQSQFQID